MPLISALVKQRQKDLCEFEVSLVYRLSSRTVTKATVKPCLEKTGRQTEVKITSICDYVRLLVLSKTEFSQYKNRSEFYIGLQIRQYGMKVAN